MCGRVPVCMSIMLCTVCACVCVYVCVCVLCVCLSKFAAAWRATDSALARQNILQQVQMEVLTL